jgi:hypothetical protein
MAVLEGTRVEQRAKPVRGISRRGRRHPVLAEDAGADLEVELALEIHITGGQREGVRRIRRAARRGAAARLVLAVLALAEVGSWRKQARQSLIAAGAGLGDAGKERQGRAEGNRAGEKRAARAFRRCFLRRLPARSRDCGWGGCTNPTEESGPFTSKG